MTDAGSCEEYAVAAIRPWFGSSVRGTAYDSSTYSNRLRHPHPHPHPHPLRFGISPVSGYKRNRHEADCQRTFPKNATAGVYEAVPRSSAEETYGL